MMEHIFYALTIFPLLWETLSLNNTETVQRVMKNKDHKHHTLLAFLMLAYFIWVCVGLISSQWKFFLVLLILSIIKKEKLWLRRLDSIMSIFLLISIIIFKYNIT